MKKRLFGIVAGSMLSVMSFVGVAGAQGNGVIEPFQVHGPIEPFQVNGPIEPFQGSGAIEPFQGGGVIEPFWERADPGLDSAPDEHGGIVKTEHGSGAGGITPTKAGTDEHGPILYVKD